jgi:hypothetical protein
MRLVGLLQYGSVEICFGTRSRRNDRWNCFTNDDNMYVFYLCVGVLAALHGHGARADWADGDDSVLGVRLGA